MVFPHSLLTKEILSTVCGRAALEIKRFSESYASVQNNPGKTCPYFFPQVGKC